MAFNLLITETTDEHIKIAGVLADKLATSLMGRSKEEVPPLEIQFDKVAEHLESAVACATMGGALEGNRIMFKHPVTIKSAAQEKPEVVLDDFGLSEAIKQASAGSLTKSATNAFCDELVEAIDNAKIDAQGVMEMSMPLKLEFRDEATKAAFMSLGRKRKLKKAAAVLKQYGRDEMLGKLITKLAQVMKSAEPKGQKVQPGSRKGGKSEPASSDKPGGGGRFKAMKNKLKGEKGVKDPGALAAAIGRSKYGKGKFQSMAAHGK